MKRTAYCLLAAALALGFNACEGHKSDDLPEHYQHKIGGHDTDEVGTHKKEGHEVEKPHEGAAKPAEAAPHAEKKPH